MSNKVEINDKSSLESNKSIDIQNSNYKLWKDEDINLYDEFVKNCNSRCKDCSFYNCCKNDYIDSNEEVELKEMREE